MLVTIVLTLALAIGQPLLTSAREEAPPLYATLFFAEQVPAESLPLLPDSLARVVGEYQKRLASFEAHHAIPDSVEPPLRWLMQKRHALERGMTALLGPEVQSLAFAFAESCLLCYEWEGISDCPIAEARCAERWLATGPDSPLQPCVLLFLGHRLRAAAECLEAEGRPADAVSANRRAAASLERAETLGNPLVRYMAGELDAASAVYLHTR